MSRRSDRRNERWREKNQGEALKVKSEKKAMAMAKDADIKVGESSEITGRVFVRAPGSMVKLLLGGVDYRAAVDSEIYRMVAGVAPPSEPDTRYLLAQAERVIKQQQAQLEAITEGPKQLALVLSVNQEKKVCTVSVGGQQLEVNAPASIVGLAPGVQVKLAKTGQIAEVDHGSIALGEVCAVRRVMPDSLEIDHNMAVRTIARGVAREVEKGDRVVVDSMMTVALRVLPKSESEFAFPRTTPVQWDDIGGLEEAKAALIEAIELPNKHRDLFARYGKRPVRGVLLYGPPGCGKTMIAKATATALARIYGEKVSAGFLYIKGPEILSQWVGAAESKIREIFASTRAYAAANGHPAVVFIDEAEAILGSRSSPMGAGLERTIVPQFLAEMDGLEESGALVLLATNRPDALDPAVVRDGRIDRKVHIGRPTAPDAIRIFALALRGRPLQEGAAALSAHATREMFSDELALYKATTAGGGSQMMTLGHMTNGAMIAGVVERAASLAMHRDIASGNAESFGIGRDDLAAAVRLTLKEARGVDHRDAVWEFAQKHRATMFERVEEICA